ncbi:MAG TPA: LCP family protein, partial [Jatrophihabitantaceae bacterium]|nr:LCP family protein [Jatrophihabitantaceae bacterium]
MSDQRGDGGPQLRRAAPGAHRSRVAGRRHWRRRILIGAGAVLMVVVVAGAGGYAYVQYRFHQIHREKVTGLAPITAAPGQGGATQDPYNILLVGDNCRDCLDGSQSNLFGSAADVGGGRSDVTMLLHVAPATGKVAILSIPRDLWLPIPDSDNELRVDAALNSGPGTLVTTIEDALNIPINHYIELNFDTFQDVVNALGGINMYFPARVWDSYSTLNMPAGCFHLDGTQALQVARARHMYYQQGGVWQYDGLGDISRIERDHEFLKVLATAVSAKGLGNPITDNNLIATVAKDLTIDSTFTLTDLGRMAETFSHVNIGTAPQTTLSVDEDNSPNGFVFKGTQYGDVV